MRATIEGIQEAQAWNLRKIAAVRPRGALGRAILYGTTAAHRGAVARTHVDTGALRASQRMVMYGDSEGQVFLDGSATNPRTGQRTAAYGPWEHERGGEHAFYQRTVDEDGPGIEQEMASMIGSAVRDA